MMKKLIKLAALAAFAISALAFASCDKKTCESNYYEFYIIKNATDREIIVSPDYDESEEGLRSVTLSPGNTRIVYETALVGRCTATSLMEDMYDGDEVLPGSHYGYGDNYYYYGYYGYNRYLLSMTIAGEEVAEDIWLRKHWTFESSHYTCSYTLTVTDELLDGLAMK